MHLKRWLTAIIALPALIFLVGYAPKWGFLSLLCAAAIVGMFECYRLTDTRAPKLMHAWNVLLTVALFSALVLRRFFFIPAIILFYALLPMVFSVFERTPPEETITTRTAKGVFASIYVSLPLVLLGLIYFRPWGRAWVFFLLAVVFAGDTGAFYAGKALGRHKLHPRVSPGKTWEGAIGGWIGSLIAARVFLLFFPLHPLNVQGLALVTLLSAAGQIGDLAESLLKRNHGIKDSGQILPGHGGILDRIDGLLFAIPVLFVYLLWYS